MVLSGVPWKKSPVTLPGIDPGTLRLVYIYIHKYITRLASNEILSPSNKIHREVGRAKDLSAPRVITAELHLYGSIGMACPPDIKKLRTIAYLNL